MAFCSYQAITAQGLFQPVACTLCNTVYLLWPLLPVLLVDMQCLYLQAQIDALQTYAASVMVSNVVSQQRAEGAEALRAALQQRTEDAEAANATLVKQALAANELCSSVQRRLHKLDQANKSLRCRLHEQEQVAQVRRQLSLRSELQSCSATISFPRVYLGCSLMFQLSGFDMTGACDQLCHT